LNVLIAPAAATLDGRLEIKYPVKVADIPGQLFHVSTDIKNINQPALELSLPTWTPGWYTTANYAKNIFRLRVTEPGGRRLQPMLVRKQTWRVETTGSHVSPSSSIIWRRRWPRIRRYCARL
jgi:predicted metalloprotease with PDZ domain